MDDDQINLDNGFWAKISGKREEKFSLEKNPATRAFFHLRCKFKLADAIMQKTAETAAAERMELASAQDREGKNLHFFRVFIIGVTHTREPWCNIENSLKQNKEFANY